MVKSQIEVPVCKYISSWQTFILPTTFHRPKKGQIVAKNIMNTCEKSELLNIANTCKSTKNLGPGIRAVVWVQGCPHRCPGCIAPEWLPFETARLVSPEELVEELIVPNEITGLTFSGGEPMDQAKGLSQLAKLARQKMDLNIICFTGYRYERLVRNPPNPCVTDLLSEVDVLIDGAYIRDLNDNKGLRGSSNQRIIHLSTRLDEFDLENFPRKVDVRIDQSQAMMVGIPPISMEGFIQGLFPVQVTQNKGRPI